MNETKKPVESKTLWGAAAMLLAWALGFYDVDIAAAELGEQFVRAEEAVRVLLGVGGFFLTLYGRVSASRKIRFSGDQSTGQDG